MTKTLRVVTACLVVIGIGMATTPLSANGLPVATGTLTPENPRPGSVVTVTFDAPSGTGQCDDIGPNDSDGVYSGRPLVFGLFPATVALEVGGNWPTAWYQGGTPLTDLGFATKVGTLAPFPVGLQSGWEGSFTGQVTLPATIPPGLYNAIWSCGQPIDEIAYDAGSPAVITSITVTGNPDPDPEPAPDGISLTLDFNVGDNIRSGNSGVPVSGAGLKPGAAYEVVLRSDPVVIGNGSNDPNGAFSATYPVPANTPAGPHSVTVTSLNTADEVVSAAAWFTLNDNGVVTAISFDGPTAAAAKPSYTG